MDIEPNTLYIPNVVIRHHIAIFLYPIII